MAETVYCTCIFLDTMVQHRTLFRHSAVIKYFIFKILIVQTVIPKCNIFCVWICVHLDGSDSRIYTGISSYYIRNFLAVGRLKSGLTQASEPVLKQWKQLHVP